MSAYNESVEKLRCNYLYFITLEGAIEHKDEIDKAFDFALDRITASTNQRILDTEVSRYIADFSKDVCKILEIEHGVSNDQMPEDNSNARVA